MGFTICYRFQAQKKVFEHPANCLTPHDAVCYALFDSPAVLWERPSSWEGNCHRQNSQILFLACGA
ncbi:hypothetical protein J2Y56_003925 [Pseudomonas sp. BE134]|nr:hypothetical protein [Pseudomonas sp. BE134]